MQVSNFRKAQKTIRSSSISLKKHSPNNLKKPVSKEGTERLVRSAMKFAIEQKKPSVTLVHKGNIMKFTEGGFRDWGYALAKNEFGATLIDKGPWMEINSNGHKIVIKDSIADAFLQQILLRPDEYSVVATLNLNG